jgi:tetratricopeptide (TPR) repeat protein
MIALACLLTIAPEPAEAGFWARTLARSPQVVEALREGDEHLSRRSSEQIMAAEAAYAQAVRLAPSDVRARTAHAEALERLGRYAECVDELLAARALDSVADAGPLAMSLGVCRVRTGDYAGAVLEYRRALDAASGLLLGAVHWNLGDALMALGHLSEAIAHYHAAERAAAGAPSGSLLARARPVLALMAAMARDRAGEDVVPSIAKAAPPMLAALGSQLGLFFVPPEDRFYALALAYEATSDRARSLEFWAEYLRVSTLVLYRARAAWHEERLRTQGVPGPVHK